MYLVLEEQVDKLFKVEGASNRPARRGVYVRLHALKFIEFDKNYFYLNKNYNRTDLDAVLRLLRGQVCVQFLGGDVALIYSIFIHKKVQKFLYKNNVTLLNKNIFSLKHKIDLFVFFLLCITNWHWLTGGAPWRGRGTPFQCPQRCAHSPSPC
jgi:hypothetical protein